MPGKAAREFLGKTLETSNTTEPPLATQPGLERRVGLFDATMMVMGGIVGSGLFINAFVVARQVHTPPLILGAWLVGGLMAMLGAFIYAELADRLPNVGGQYAYLRDAYHPMLGFLYGWVLLLVTQTGGMAAVTVTFARYFVELTGWRVSDRMVAVAALALLTLVNCLGVKMGSRVQSALMVMKIAAISMLVIAGLLLIPSPHPLLHPVLDQPPSWGLLAAFGSALTPVFFAYGGWQTTNFIAGEIRNPHRNLPRALLMGVGGVIAIYVTVNLVYVRALGPAALAGTTVPASAVMRLAWGESGAKWIAFGITISTLGFLSQSVLTAPRVYFAMAQDGLFFRSVAKVSRRTRVPVVAIVLQSVWTVVIALSGRYEQILNYVVAMDFVFFGLTATCVFVFRRRETGQPANPGAFRIPAHPYSTVAFIAMSWLVVGNTIYRYPANSLLGFALLLMGVPVYAWWSRTRHRQPHS